MDGERTDRGRRADSRERWSACALACPLARSPRVAPRRRARALAVALGCTSAIGALGLPAVATAALPTIATHVVTAPLANFGSHRGVTSSAGCAAGSQLVGGGGYLRAVSDPATPPTNGLVLGGSAPSTGASPVDLAAPDATVDPATWFAIANFTGVSEAGDQASSFALCATSGGPAHTVVKTATATGLLATQEVQQPIVATATCPAATRLIGGGATTSTPDQVNDATTVGNTGNLKPAGSYPSDGAGIAAPDGATTADSWSAYGSSGISAATDTVTAYALCSTDAATAPVEVARSDADGPDAQAGTTITTASATCPATTRLLGGGYSYDETVAGTGSGLQPQQGYHPRGSWPSTPGTPPVAVADATANPTTWSALVQAGGQSLASGKHMTTRAFALCATDPAVTTAPVVQTAAASATGATTTTLGGSVTPGGLSTAYVFEYGTSLSFGAITTPDGAGSGSSSVPVSGQLSGLLAGRTYYYRLVATNADGTTLGVVHSVTTVGSSPPVAQTTVATQITSSAATLTGLLDPLGQRTAFTFEVFGPDGSRLTAIDNAGADGVDEAVALPIAGLSPGVTYLFRLVATNASGTTTGAIASFTTSAAGAPAR